MAVIRVLVNCAECQGHLFEERTNPQLPQLYRRRCSSHQRPQFPQHNQRPMKPAKTEEIGERISAVAHSETQRQTEVPAQNVLILPIERARGLFLAILAQ